MIANTKQTQQKQMAKRKHVFRHFLSGPPPRHGPPRAYFIFMFYNPNPKNGWLGTLYTPCGSGPGGFRSRVSDCDLSLTFQAEVTCEGCFPFIKFGMLEILSETCPGGPSGALGVLGGFQNQRPPELARGNCEDYLEVTDSEVEFQFNHCTSETLAGHIVNEHSCLTCFGFRNVRNVMNFQENEGPRGAPGSLWGPLNMSKLGSFETNRKSNNPWGRKSIRNATLRFVKDGLLQRHFPRLFSLIKLHVNPCAPGTLAYHKVNEHFVVRDDVDCNAENCLEQSLLEVSDYASLNYGNCLSCHDPLAAVRFGCADCFSVFVLNYSE